MSVDYLTFVGDIHGRADLLHQLLASVLRSGTSLVFLGDYGDRGPDTRDVIDTLVALKDQRPKDVHFLAGNHDDALLSVAEGAPLSRLLAMGGGATVRSYVPRPTPDLAQAFREALPPSHLEFLRSLRRYWSGHDVFASHFESDGDRFAAPGQYRVHGHVVQTALTPTVHHDRSLIDTGSGVLPDGRLTAFYYPSKRWVQAGPAVL